MEGFSLKTTAYCFTCLIKLVFLNFVFPRPICYCLFSGTGAGKSRVKLLWQLLLIYTLLLLYFKLVFVIFFNNSLWIVKSDFQYIWRRAKQQIDHICNSWNTKLAWCFILVFDTSQDWEYLLQMAVLKKAFLWRFPLISWSCK